MVGPRKNRWIKASADTVDAPAESGGDGGGRIGLTVLGNKEKRPVPSAKTMQRKLYGEKDAADE